MPRPSFSATERERSIVVCSWEEILRNSGRIFTLVCEKEEDFWSLCVRVGWERLSKLEYADSGEPSDELDGFLLSSDRGMLLPELDCVDMAGLSARLSRGDLLSFPLRQPGRPRLSSRTAEGAKEVMEDTLVVLVEKDIMDGTLPPVC